MSFVYILAISLTKSYRNERLGMRKLILLLIVITIMSCSASKPVKRKKAKKIPCSEWSIIVKETNCINTKP